MAQNQNINNETSEEAKDTILVVDDESNNRFLLKTHLQSADYHIVMATNGKEAIAAVKKSPPDLIILDIMMPEMDGFQVCECFRKIPATMIVPIVMVTALRGTDERVKGIEAGADDFISKPFNRMELLTRVKSLLRIKKLNEALEQKIIELEKTKDKLRQLAITDGLTGIYNHRYFRQQLRLEVSRSTRFNLPISLIIFDIDHFKRYNDQFGHLNGDKVLNQFARTLRSNIREVDCLARYGGEEFALVLPGTNKDAALKVAEKLRIIIAHTPFPNCKKLPEGMVTASAGVASFPEDATNDEELIQKTDTALYQAKNSGRNKTVAI